MVPQSGRRRREAEASRRSRHRRHARPGGGRMIFLPVVERELRGAARRRGTYWGRFVAALLGAGLAAWVLLAVGENDTKVGPALLEVVSSVVFFYATITGILVTCDCLSEEKREGTLGLLFLTD